MYDIFVSMYQCMCNIYVCVFVSDLCVHGCIYIYVFASMCACIFMDVFICRYIYGWEKNHLFTF